MGALTKFLQSFKKEPRMTQKVTVTNAAGTQGVRVFVMDRVIGPDRVSEQHDLPREGDKVDVTIHSTRYLMVTEYNVSSIPAPPPPSPA